MVDNRLKYEDGTEALAHCCSYCGRTFLNRTDDINFEKYEDLWFIDIKDGQKVEFCIHCKREMELKGE